MTDRATAREHGRVSEIGRFFRTATTPVYFVSATAFNLLGIDRWIPTFRYVNYCDSFDGYHPNVFVPRHHESPAFESIEGICNYLSRTTSAGARGSTRSGWAIGCGRRATAGYFELDFLADVDSGELYLGELVPRVTGASSMTNVTAVAYRDMPIFLFQLLEFADVDYEIDVAALNEAWGHPGAVDEWSQFIEPTAA